MNEVEEILVNLKLIFLVSAFRLWSAGELARLYFMKWKLKREIGKMIFSFDFC